MRFAAGVRDLAIAACFAILGAGCGRALAQEPPPIYASAEPFTAGEYFIDFRSRPSSYIGHTYIVYGRVDARGRVAEMHYAGLIPERAVWRGLFVPIRATVRKYIDDTRLTPTAIYRRRLTAGEYRRVIRMVAYLRSNEHQWHAVFQNCNDFAATIAEQLGLWRPPTLVPPSVWVASLRGLNER